MRDDKLPVFLFCLSWFNCFVRNLRLIVVLNSTFSFVIYTYTVRFVHDRYHIERHNTIWIYIGIAISSGTDEYYDRVHSTRDHSYRGRVRSNCMADPPFPMIQCSNFVHNIVAMDPNVSALSVSVFHICDAFHDVTSFDLHWIISKKTDEKYRKKRKWNNNNNKNDVLFDFIGADLYSKVCVTHRFITKLKLCSLCKPEARVAWRSITVSTLLALWYFFISTSPMTRNGGKLFQHVFIAHDPLTPWHLQSVRNRFFTS